MHSDDIEIAKMAAFTAGQLNEVDSSTIERSSTGPARRIDPRNFIPKSELTQPKKPKHQIVKDNQFVEPPKNKYIGSEVRGKTSVDLNSLMIPMPDDLKKYVPEEEQKEQTQQHVALQVDKTNDDIQKSKFAQKIVDIDSNMSKMNKKINKMIKILSELSRNER